MSAGVTGGTADGVWNLDVWLSSPGDLLRVLAIGTAAYILLVAVLRVSGKRTLSKLNAFDLVVTVALGSTLATVLLDRSTSWMEGATALVLLCVLQFVVAYASVRIGRFRSVVTSQPTVLMTGGVMYEDRMRAQRVSVEELHQAVRCSGIGDLTLVGAVVLESDGTLSVINRELFGDGSALEQ